MTSLCTVVTTDVSTRGSCETESGEKCTQNEKEDRPRENVEFENGDVVVACQIDGWLESHNFKRRSHVVHLGQRLFKLLPWHDCPYKQHTIAALTDAVIFSQLQIGHTHATHAHLLGGDDEAVCTTCYTSLTVNHILIECRPQFNHIANFGRTLKDLFNSTNVSAYNRCSTFLF